MPAHYTTLLKARLRGTASFLEAQRIPYFKTDLFNIFGFKKTRGWLTLRDDNQDRRHPEHKTRGRPPIITPKDLLRIEQILWKYGFEARRLSWKALTNEASI